MATEVRAFGFPCGETSCMDLATKELQLSTLEDYYQMPLCAKHAQRLDKVITDYERRISAHN